MGYEIDNQWKLWYHSIKDNNWTKSSYNELYTVQNLFDYYFITNHFKQNHYQNGMFFLMKENVFPNWEDPSNREGGCLSFKVRSCNILNEWNELLLRCITNNILNHGNESINGISISPKKEFNIVKIWFANNKPNDHKGNYNGFGNDFQLINSIYKKHDI